MKYYILFLFIFCSFYQSAKAQTGEDKVILKAMQDELERSRELKLPNEEKPFFIAFHFVRYNQYEIKGSLGSIISSTANEQQSIGAVDILLGNCKQTNQKLFGAAVPGRWMPTDLNYDEMRRRYWLQADRIYKDAAFMLADKKAHEQTALQNESAIDDWTFASPITRYVDSKKDIAFDKAGWEDKVCELSEVFNAYPELFDTSVAIKVFQADVYMKTTDGTTLRYPVYSTMLMGMARVITNSGGSYFDNIVTVAEFPNELPDIEDMKKKYRELCENLVRIKNATPMKESYSGPVLFEGACVAQQLGRIMNSILTPTRQQNNLIMLGKTSVRDRFETKIVDSKLTVKNYAHMKEYKGQRVYGACEFDAEGVIPEAELTLIDKGVLKHFLNNRVPKIDAPQSTGSARFQLTGGVLLSTSPHILHISTSEGMSREKMRKELIKIAKEEGLKYAYIIRTGAGSRFLPYRINVETGEEELITDLFFFGFEFDDLRHLVGISNEEVVCTSPYADNRAPITIIAPAGLLMDNCILLKSRRADTKEVLEHPMMRMSKK